MWGKIMVVAIIGAKRITRTATLAVRMWQALTKLVVEDGADIFMFTDDGAFDDACWLIVSQLQMQYPNIRRIYMREEYRGNTKSIKDIVKGYEKVLEFDASSDDATSAQMMRNSIMVEMCDVLVTYFDTGYKPTPRIEDEEERIAKFAKRKKKRVINLFDV